MNASGSASARIAMYCAVHGPMPGSASKRARTSARSLAGSSASSPLASRRVSARSVSRRRPGPTAPAEQRGVRRGDRGRRREEVCQPAVGRRQGLPQRVRETPSGGPRGGDRDLLAEDRAHCQLGAVDAPGHAHAGQRVDQRREQRVAREVLGGDGGIGIEVEQASAALHGGREIAQIGEAQPALDVARLTRAASAARGHQRDGAVAVWQAQRAAVDLAPHLLDAGDGAVGEEAQKALPGQRLAVGQAHRQRARPVILDGARFASVRPGAARSACGRRWRESCR